MEQQDRNNWKHPDDKPLLSSANDFKIFMNESPIWKDLRGTIEDRIELLQNEFPYCDDVERMKELRTEIRTLKEMLGLPAYLADRVELEKPNQ